MTSQLKTNKNRPNLWFGAYREESTDLFTAGSGEDSRWIDVLFQVRGVDRRLVGSYSA